MSRARGVPWTKSPETNAPGLSLSELLLISAVWVAAAPYAAEAVGPCARAAAARRDEAAEAGLCAEEAAGRRVSEGAEGRRDEAAEAAAEEEAPQRPSEEAEAAAARRRPALAAEVEVEEGQRQRAAAAAAVARQRPVSEAAARHVSEGEAARHGVAEEGQRAEAEVARRVSEAEVARRVSEAEVARRVSEAAGGLCAWVAARPGPGWRSTRSQRRPGTDARGTGDLSSCVSPCEWVERPRRRAMDAPVCGAVAVRVPASGRGSSEGVCRVSAKATGMSGASRGFGATCGERGDWRAVAAAS